MIVDIQTVRDRIVAAFVAKISMREMGKYTPQRARRRVLGMVLAHHKELPVLIRLARDVRSAWPDCGVDMWFDQERDRFHSGKTSPFVLCLRPPFDAGPDFERERDFFNSIRYRCKDRSVSCRNTEEGVIVTRTWSAV